MDDKIILIPAVELYPHPDNPRKDLGDLSELTDSIRAMGVLQNLTVTPREGGGYTVLGGHRRRAAAINAGLEYLPCVVIGNISPADQIALMMCENMQRNELTLAEQAHGMQMMIDLGISAAEVAKKTGLSESTVRRRLKLSEFDKSTLERACEKNISIDDILSLSEIKDAKKRDEVLKKAGTAEFANARYQAIQQQKVAENMPLMLKEFEALAEEVKKIDYQKYTYSMSFYAFDYKPGALAKYIKKNKIIGKNVFSRTVNCLTLYTEKSVKDKRPKTPEEIEQEQKLADIDRRKKDLALLTENFYELRCDFVSTLHQRLLTDEFFAWLGVKMATAALVYNPAKRYQDIEDYFTDSDIDLPGEDKSVYTHEPETFDAIMKAIDDEPRMKLQMMLFALGDSSRRGFVDSTYYREYPRHEDNPELCLIYEALERLGYQMCEAERQLMDGTHPLFDTDRTENNEL